MALTTLQLNKLQEATTQAKISEVVTGIPAELTVAQWALETAWGKSQPGNNCFGIKEYKGCDGRQLLRTTEYFTPQERIKWVAAKPGRTATLVYGNESHQGGRYKYRCDDWFATFDSLSKCFDLRGQLLSRGRYKPALVKYQNGGSLYQYIVEVSAIYATDPKYAAKVLSILAMKQVKEVLSKYRVK